MIMILTIEVFGFKDEKIPIRAAVFYYRLDKSILAYLIIYYANANPIIWWYQYDMYTLLIFNWRK